MSQVKIVYWSGTGNTEAMAEMIAAGVTAAGGEAVVMPVAKATVAELKEAKAFALGCPSMGAEQLEETEMEPFMCELESEISGKQIVLFGSYGWGDQEWMRDWEKRIEAAGATVIDGAGITANEAPDGEAEEKCKAAGEKLVKAI